MSNENIANVSKRVKHGEYIKNPKCVKCGKDVSHEWLGGDYTLIVCSAECIRKI